jgi:DNA-directed RNA polymerase subunit beta
MEPSSLINIENRRRNFSKIPKVMDIPYLLDIQKKSFEQFLQKDVPPEERKDIGLQSVFKSVFPIKDFNELSFLEFVEYTIGEPKYDIFECEEKGLTYAAPIKVVCRLVVCDLDKTTGTKNIRNVKEQEVYFSEIPLMTDTRTFVINGTDRVVVSQLHRSPGLFFSLEKSKTYQSGMVSYTAKIIPHRGSWLDFEFDNKNILYVRIDRRRKFPVTVLLKTLGYTTEDLLNYYYQKEKVIIKDGKVYRGTEYDYLIGERLSEDLVDPKNNEIILKKSRKITRLGIKRLRESGIKEIPMNVSDIVGKSVFKKVVDPISNEVILEQTDKITQESIEIIESRGIKELELIHIDNVNIDSSLLDTLAIDKINASEKAIIEIYRRLRPSDPPTIDIAKQFFENLFFNPERYDLSNVGRLNINHKLKLDTPLEHRTLTKVDILETVKFLIGLRNGKGSIDDIDHLGRRRVRSIGELLENQYRIGLVRMERAIKEKMSLQEVDTLMPHDLINAKLVSATIKEFFGTSQLSQFMDQTNPLSELTHKRRLSALGPGGLTRERAGFEVRDVHPTHYGRICPIETPEGPNIGLIASLSTYAQVNEYGFIETPYRKVINGVVTNEIEFLSALQEEDHIIAQANALIDKEGRFINNSISTRKSGEFIMATPDEIDYIDVSTTQLVSCAAALIPFLENDDANRALMGSNMQRQAVPLMKTDAPLVGTGMERIIAMDSGTTVLAKHSGVIESVDAARIVIKCDEDTQEPSQETGVDVYNLIKFQLSNQNTCINQKPIVELGQRVKKGEVIADGMATCEAELALGRNILVAFMPWGGYNFEDSILISEKVVGKDHFTSIHIEEFEVFARDTKLGKEEITRDIPNLGEEILKNLDEDGIIRIGAEVKSGDILVGKITPKGETLLSPEEKLLRAIFGEKARDIQNTSLKVPPGVEGIVMNIKVFSRTGVEKDEMERSTETGEALKYRKDLDDELKILKERVTSRLKGLLVGKILRNSLINEKGKTVLGRNKEITEEKFLSISIELWKEVELKDDEVTQENVINILENYLDQANLLEIIYNEKIEKLGKGDELPPGVIKLVKVNIATKRKLSVGDKMAGRHGNKGVLSQILPEEEMPYLPNGTPIEIVLNPLGVPSRMNVGQILETHLGWAVRGLGELLDKTIKENYSPEVLRKKLKEVYPSQKMIELLDKSSDEEILKFAKKLKNGMPIATPVFDGASESEIKDLLELSGLPKNGKITLYDGRTGEPFDQEITVGIMYMLKLHHLVDDKIHARSIGTYSLVTQQPLGGKAQFGGQRLGEMEVWALEAYGASYTLQEFLTVKSDDVLGRTRTYENIVKGKNALEMGIPESFNVLIKELQSLCLDIQTIEVPEEEIPR